MAKVLRQTRAMGVSYMVRAATREQCAERLDELCRLLGAVPTTLPTDAIGPGWVARAAIPSTDSARAGYAHERAPGR